MSCPAGSSAAARWRSYAVVPELLPHRNLSRSFSLSRFCSPSPLVILRVPSVSCFRSLSPSLPPDPWPRYARGAIQLGARSGLSHCDGWFYPQHDQFTGCAAPPPGTVFYTLNSGGNALQRRLFVLGSTHSHQETLENLPFEKITLTHHGLRESCIFLWTSDPGSKEILPYEILSLGILVRLNFGWISR